MLGLDLHLVALKQLGGNIKEPLSHILVKSVILGH